MDLLVERYQQIASCASANEVRRYATTWTHNNEYGWFHGCVGHGTHVLVAMAQAYCDEGRQLDRVFFHGGNHWVVIARIACTRDQSVAAFAIVGDASAKRNGPTRFLKR